MLDSVLADAETKQCALCKEYKTLDKFTPSQRSNKNGRCQECVNQTSRDYYAEVVAPQTRRKRGRPRRVQVASTEALKLIDAALHRLNAAREFIERNDHEIAAELLYKVREQIDVLLTEQLEGV